MNASRKTVVGLILAATALFVVGIVLEKNSGEHHDESVALASNESGETPAEHAAESGGSTTTEKAPATQAKKPAAGSESAAPNESPAEHAAESGGETHNESSEKVLGIKYESTPLVILAVLASLGLAALVWFGRRPWIFLLVAAAMIAFAVFDIAEVFHQVDISEGGIAALAALVAVLHLAAALGSAQLRRERAAT